MELVLISGLSGSGKSVALHVLEDRGYYCVDNMPVLLLNVLCNLLQQEGYPRAAIAIDARSGDGIEHLPEKIRSLRSMGHSLTFLFLDAQDDTLIKRFSETRRRHPLAGGERTLPESIGEERRLLQPLVELGHKLDTSGLKAAALREWVVQISAAPVREGLTLLFQSFGFKHGLPLDADLVFDARCLPNPYYEPELRPLTGLDAPIAEFLEAEPHVLKMRADIHRFVADWLPAYAQDSRAYLTVAIGCTGGQHRSVYLAEWMGRQFDGALAQIPRVLVRHRALASQS
ncbi:nucleotide-binding protein [Betaproteobacteria bacterium]|nr:nucleotide-binding protein [Betaproteobacteria bacterium]GHU41082.1 nucleotide-binding protein [Betaproteobacteria bacterium]